MKRHLTLLSSSKVSLLRRLNKCFNALWEVYLFILPPLPGTRAVEATFYQSYLSNCFTFCSFDSKEGRGSCQIWPWVIKVKMRWRRFKSPSLDSCFILCDCFLPVKQITMINIFFEHYIGIMRLWSTFHDQSLNYLLSCWRWWRKTMREPTCSSSRPFMFQVIFILQSAICGLEFLNLCFHTHWTISMVIGFVTCAC